MHIPRRINGHQCRGGKTRRPIKYVAIITVGGVTPTQLDLSSRRAQRDLAPRRLGVFVFDTERLITKTEDIESSSEVFHSLKLLLSDSTKTIKPAAQSFLNSASQSCQKFLKRVGDSSA